MKSQAPLNDGRIHAAADNNKPNDHVARFCHRQIQGIKHKTDLRNTNLGLVYGFC